MKSAQSELASAHNERNQKTKQDIQATFGFGLVALGGLLCPPLAAAGLGAVYFGARSSHRGVVDSKRETDAQEQIAAIRLRLDDEESLFRQLDIRLDLLRNEKERRLGLRQEAQARGISDLDT
jgi:hypothetical protein